MVAGLLLFGLPMSAEWTLTAYLGDAHTDQTSLRLEAPKASTDLLLQPISFQTKPFQSPLYYGYRAGYFFNSLFGFEA